MKKPLTNKKVLIIENEMVFRSQLFKYPCSLCPSVYEATDINEALSFMEQHDMDIILCSLALSPIRSIIMPKTTELDFIKYLLLKKIKVPMLIFSSQDQMQAVTCALRLV